MLGEEETKRKVKHAVSIITFSLCLTSVVLLTTSLIIFQKEQFIQTVKGQNNFWQQDAFLTCSWRFLISNKLKQLEFKLENIFGA